MFGEMRTLHRPILSSLFSSLLLFAFMHFLLLEQPHSKEAVTNEQVSYVDDRRVRVVVEMDHKAVLVAIDLVRSVAAGAIGLVRLVAAVAIGLDHILVAMGLGHTPVAMDRC